MVEKNEILRTAYDIEEFRKAGHALVDMLSGHLTKGQQNQEKVLHYQTPESELNFWKQQPETQDVLSLFKNIIQHSINVQHPHFIGHQVAVPALMSGLSSLLVDILGNGTGVYEMGMASNAIEKVVTDMLAKTIGFDVQACGHLTSGGTLANLTAMLAARKTVDDQFKIKTGLLEPYFKAATEKGYSVIAIVGSACSTATGSYDDLEALGHFAQVHNIWFHVDGAHGGAVIFSDKYKHLLKGIEQADSVVIDFHKMLMTPSLTTALIFKRASDSYQTFQQQANYLWNDSATHEWYNSSKRTFECTKLMMSIKVFTIMKVYGLRIFEENVNQLYDLGRAFAELIKADNAFELAIEPETNIVNFRYVDAPEETLDEVNTQLRQRLIEEGNFYLVQTVLNNKVFLRCSIMNPLTKISDLKALLERLKLK